MVRTLVFGVRSESLASASWTFREAKQDCAIELASHACACSEVTGASSDRQSARPARRSGLRMIGLNAESKCSAAEGGAILSL